MAKQFRENVEIISSANGQSGLKLTNLPAWTNQSTFNGVLWIDASGNVVKIAQTSLAPVTVSATAPASPVAWQQWLDTSVTPSELKVRNGTSWELVNDEVQHYANFASFPATGDEDILYIDDATDTAYVWDSTTTAYVALPSSATGLFSITDWTTTETVNVWNTIAFTDWNLIKTTVLATDTIKNEIDTTWAITWQVIWFNGTNAVWKTADNIYTVDWTLLADRTVTMSDNGSKNLTLSSATAWREEIIQVIQNTWTFLYQDDLGQNLYAGTVYADYFNGGANNWMAVWSFDWISTVYSRWTSLRLISNNNSIVIDSVWLWEYYIPTTPPVYTWSVNQKRILVRDDSDGKIYKRDITTIPANRYAETITPVPNTQYTVTHNLWTLDVIVQVRDAATNEVVDVEIDMLTTNTVGITSTTSANLRVVVM